VKKDMVESGSLDVDAYCAKVMSILEAEGEVDKIQNLLSRLVADSNWRDDVKRMSSKKMDGDAIEDVTPESVTEMVMADAIEALPNSLQEAVTKYITEFLKKKKVPAESAEAKGT
jgi:hypothetical protein